MAQRRADTAEGLVRAISARGLVASIVNATVGAGIGGSRDRPEAPPWLAVTGAVAGLSTAVYLLRRR